MNKKILTILLAMSLVFAMLPAQGFAAVKKAGTPTEVNSLTSREYKEGCVEHNYVNITTDGTSLYIDCETPIETARFGINVRGVEPSTSSIWLKWAYPENKGDYYHFQSKISASECSDGTYVLLISMTKPGAEKSCVFYKNCNFKVSSGTISLIQWDSIIKENNKFIKKTASLTASKFKKKNLSDIQSIALKDPVTKKVSAITDKKASYIKKTSDSIVGEAATDYEKVFKIYEYLGENFYYDNKAFSTKTKQYVDPYRNLYNLRNKKKSANSEDGKVATTCVGYAAAVIALARAQGIPAVMCNGHHVGMSDKFNNWSTEEGITTMDHWWAECYIKEQDRWIIVDATPANSNKWDRDKNEWTYTGITNYIFFDPTPEQLATSHEFFEIKGVK